MRLHDDARSPEELLIHLQRSVKNTVARQRHYANEMVRLRCSVDLLALGVFPNFKEVTESFAAFEAVQSHLPGWKLNDPSIAVLCVGDGNTPRTAATFAFRSAWSCYSVDPRLKADGAWVGIRRLTVLRSEVEKVTIPGKRVVIAAVHSHAALPAAVAACVDAEEIAIVAIPCCKVQALRGRLPDLSYDDFGIASPERTVKVWRNALSLAVVAEAA